MNEIPGEIFMVAEDLILVDAHKVDVGVGGKIGEHFGEDGPMFFLTFEGRLNNSEERKSVRLMMRAEFGADLVDEMMNRFEMLVKIAHRKDGS